MNILLHFGDAVPSAESVSAFRPLIDASGTRLHVIYTHADPLLAGGQNDMNPAAMPELHAGMEAEAREKLGAIFGNAADSATIQLRSGDPIRAIVEYSNEAKIDLIVVGLASDGDEESSVARGVLDATPCSLLVWRSR
jgi:nucleotide-binding universal stress UspA family protein